MSEITCPACGKSYPANGHAASYGASCPHCGVAVQATMASVLLPTLPPREEQPTNRIPSDDDMSECISVVGQPPSPNDFTHDENLFAKILQPTQDLVGIGRLGGFRVLKVLGYGGMGVVYQAEDIKLKRMVALKAMLPKTAEDHQAGKRFLREAVAMAKVEHPNVARIYQVDEDNGVPFLAMEFLRGEPLDKRLEGSPALSITDVTRIGRGIADGLSAMHRLGLVHRDIKPANIWLESPNEFVKILDFGLARSDASDNKVTESGVVIGTPAFMAPEQARGGEVDGRTDLFSLGVVLYQMATGTMPFRGTDAVSTLVAIASDTPPSPSSINPNIPQELDRVIMQLLAKLPKKRFQTAEETSQALAAIEQSQGSKSHTATVPTHGKKPAATPANVRWIATAVALTILLASGLYVWNRDPGQVKIPPPRDPKAIVKPVLPPTGIATSPDFEWSDPINLGPEINATHRNWAPSLTDDERILVYNRNNKIWISRRDSKDVAFNKAEILPASINDLEPSFPSITADGLLLAFCAPVTAGTLDHVWLSSRKSLEEPFGAPVLLPSPVNSRTTEKPVAISSNGLRLMVTTFRRGDLGRGEIALFSRETRNDPFGKETILQAPVNTPNFDATCWLANDGRSLIATEMDVAEQTTRLFVRPETNAPFGPGQSMQIPGKVVVNPGRPWLSPDGQRMYFHWRENPKQTLSLGLWMSNRVSKHAQDMPAKFTNSLGMEFARIPKGKAWLQWASKTQKEGVVEFRDDFYLGTYEVTQGEWEALMGPNDNPSHFSRTGEDKEKVATIADAELKRFPVDSLSWNQSQQFIDRLNQKSKEAGWTYRLPTSDEWEYACRGGPQAGQEKNDWGFYFNEPMKILTPQWANFKLSDGKRPCKVGSFPPNSLGLHDMHGNVFEYIHGQDLDDNKQPLCRFRGGCWHDPADFCQVFWGAMGNIGGQYNGAGFRLARVRTGP